MFFQGKAIYVAFYVIVPLILGMRWIGARAVRSLRIERAQPKVNLFPGESAELEVRIENRGPIPWPWLKLEDGSAHDASGFESARFALSLSPWGEAVVRRTVKAVRRGVFRAGPISVEWSDPLGSALHRFKFDLYTEVMVFPRVHPLSSLGISSAIPTGSSRARIFDPEDPARVAGVRNYVRGDAFRHVHWKATAHTGEFKVKTFEPMKHLDLAIALDLTASNYRARGGSASFELAMEVAASVLGAGVKGHQAVGLYTTAARDHKGFSGMAKGGAHLRSCLEVLARAEPMERGGSAAEMIAKAHRTLGRSATLIIVAPELDEAMAGAMSVSRASGRRVHFIQIGVGTLKAALPVGVGHTVVASQEAVARLGRRSA